jgi:hypothetical protein
MAAKSEEFIEQGKRFIVIPNPEGEYNLNKKMIVKPIAIENEINTIHALLSVDWSCFMCENLIFRR